MLRTRIAPTPSGLLHTGNGASFLLTWLIAKAFEGKVLLRIDDLDSERMRPEYVEDIFASLDWLGIHPDEGPSGPEELRSRFSQELRIASYNKILDTLGLSANYEKRRMDEWGEVDMNEGLRTSGKIFACSCTRSMLPSGPYPGTCEDKGIPLDSENVAWRIRVEKDAEIRFDDLLQGTITVVPYKETGSFVVRSRNGKPAYQIASLADDLDFNINFIVRGMDLVPSTASQLYIAQQAGITAFQKTRFLHHPLITDPGNMKLSKSKGAASLQHMRLSGESPLHIYDIVAGWLGAEKGKSIAEAEEKILEKIRATIVL